MVNVFKTKKILLMPFWISQILERNSLPLATIKDLETLRTYASPEDLALTLLLNRQSAVVFGKDVTSPELALPWCKTPASMTIYNQLVDLLPLHTQSLQERLFSETNLDSRFPKAFDIHDLDGDTFLVVIYPGYFGGAAAPLNQTKLVRAYLELWYGYSNFDSVARDPLFTEYLARL